MEEYIKNRLKKENKIYAELPKEKINQLLEEMIQDSILYKTKGREYKVLK